MKRKKKVRWIRRMLGELIQVVGQNTDIMKQQDRLNTRLVKLFEVVASSVRDVMQPNWLVITEYTKININDISSIEHEQKGDEGSWRIRMHNDVEFTVPEKQLLADAARSDVFSFLPYRNFSTD